MLLRTFSNIEWIDYLIIVCLLEVICLFFLLGVRFALKSRDKAKLIKLYILSIALFLILYGLNRTIFFFHELSFKQFIWTLTPKEFSLALREDPSASQNYDILWRISTGIGSSGLFIFLLGFESQILKKETKYFLSIIQGITMCLTIIIGTTSDEITIGRLIFYFGLLPALAVPLCYFYLGSKASGAARKRAIGAGLGFLILYIGIAVNSTAGKAIFVILFGGTILGVYFTYFLYTLTVNLGLLIYTKSIQY